MERNTTQRTGAIHKSNTPQAKAQLLIDLKRRILSVRETLLTIGSPDDYMPYLIAQASRESRPLNKPERMALRQIMNGRVFSGDVERVEFIERALEYQKAA